MALQWTGSDADTVTFPGNAQINDLNAFTWLFWCYPDSVTGGSRLCARAASKDLNMAFTGTNRLFMSIGRTGTNTSAESGDNIFTTGNWHLIAATFDDLTSPRLRLFSGTLSTPIQEEDSYVAQVDGTGTPNPESGNFNIGNFPGSSVSFPGRIEAFLLFNRALSLAELLEQQIRLHQTRDRSCVVFHRYKAGGLQIDLSGLRNNGTVSGPTAAAPAPLQRSRIDFPRRLARVPAAGLSIPISAYHYNHHLGTMG